ncbi:hypothetical protein J2X66_004356 [Pseudomonas sp. 3296]|nr:hypothetical protein [Pseudomonas sp. 3296]
MCFAKGWRSVTKGTRRAATIDRLAATSFVWLFSDVDQIIHLSGS